MLPLENSDPTLPSSVTMEKDYNASLSSLFTIFKEIEKGLKGCNQRALEFSCQMQGKDLAFMRNLDFLSDHINKAEGALHEVFGLFDDFHREFAPCFNYSAPQISWIPQCKRKIPMTYISGDDPCEVFLSYKDGPSSELILREIKEKLMDSSLRPFASTPEPGMSVICSGDELSFRGVVIKQDEDDEEIIHVYDVDTQEQYPIHVRELFRLPTELQHYPASILRCTITERDEFLETWNKEEMTALFTDTLKKCNVTVDILHEVASTSSEVPPKFLVEVTVQNHGYSLNLRQWLDSAFPVDGIYRIPWQPESTKNIQMAYVSGSSPWEIFLMHKDGLDFDLISSDIKKIAKDGGLKPLTLLPKVGMSVVCYNLAFRFRGVVGGVKGKKVNVYNVDTNMHHDVGIDDLYQLPENLSIPHAAILRCCLTKDESLKESWTDEMDEMFSSVLAGNGVEISIVGCVDEEETPPKFLVWMQLHGESSSFNISSVLEEQFSIKGAATPDSIPSTCSDNGEETPLEKSIDHLRDEDVEFEPDEYVVAKLGLCNVSDSHEVESGFRSTSHLPEDLVETEEADFTGGYVPKDEQNYCYFFSRKGFCNKPVCNKPHIRKVEPFDKRQWTEERVSVHNDSINHLELPPVDAVIIVKPTALMSNRGFYGIILDSDLVLQDLDRVLGDLNEKFSKFEPLVLEPSLGEVCAALNSSGKWYRGRVVDFQGSREFTVFDLDTGSSEEMPIARLRVLPVDYLHLPFQALLFFVENCDILRKSGFLSRDYKAKIKSYVGYEANIDLLD